MLQRWPARASGGFEKSPPVNRPPSGKAAPHRIGMGWPVRRRRSLARCRRTRRRTRCRRNVPLLSHTLQFMSQLPPAVVTGQTDRTWARRPLRGMQVASATAAQTASQIDSMVSRLAPAVDSQLVEAVHSRPPDSIHAKAWWQGSTGDATDVSSRRPNSAGPARLARPADADTPNLLASSLKSRGWKGGFHGCFQEAGMLMRGPDTDNLLAPAPRVRFRRYSMEKNGTVLSKEACLSSRSYRAGRFSRS